MVVPNNLKVIFELNIRFAEPVEIYVKDLLDNAGGKMEVESSEGKGTGFKLDFKNGIP